MSILSLQRRLKGLLSSLTLYKIKRYQGLIEALYLLYIQGGVYNGYTTWAQSAQV